MNIGFMMQIFKINREIVLEVIYINIITYIKMENLYVMYKLKLDKINVMNVKKMKNKNL